MDALAKIGNSFETTGAGAVAKENERKEEARMLEDIRKKELADREREEAKQRKRKQDLLAAQGANKKLVDRKEAQKEKEREEARQMREKFLKESEELEREKAALVEKRKADARKLKQGLDDQMAVTRKGKSRTSQEALTDIELKINGGIIKRIEQDPDLQEKIISRLHAAPERRNQGFKYG